MRLLGIDPGLKTGLALFDAGRFAAGLEVEGILQLRHHLRDLRPDYLICENFLGTRGFAQTHEPLRLIGAVQMFALEAALPLRIQPPGILTTWRRRADGIHPSRHVRSAAAHVLYFINDLDSLGSL